VVTVGVTVGIAVAGLFVCIETNNVGVGMQLRSLGVNGEGLDVKVDVT